MSLESWWRAKGREALRRYLKLVGFRRVYEITLWLTHRCVYHCKFCLISENKGAFLPKEVVFDFIKEAVPYKVSHVPITGGEPMLHPDFVEICHFVRDHVSACPLYITGRLLNDTVLDEMEKKDRRWFWWLTIMSCDKELNDKYRSSGAFEDVMRATALLTERGHCVGIAINIVPETLPQLEDTIQFAFEKLKVDYVATDPIAAMGRALDDPQNALLNDEQLYSYYRLITDLIPKWQKRGKKFRWQVSSTVCRKSV